LAAEKVLIESSHIDADKNRDVDGFRAILLAHYVQQNGILSYIHLNATASVAYVNEAMATQRLDMPEKKCSSLSAATDCQAKATCYTQKRRYVSANELASPVDWEDLRTTANDSNESSLEIEWASKLRREAARPHDETLPLNASYSAEAAGAWSFNGSTFTIRTVGSKTIFAYERPRDALLSYGVAKGTPLFEGTLQQRSFVGVMHAFHRNCGTLNMQAHGDIADDDRSVSFHSQKPIFGTNCSIDKYEDDVTTFVLSGG
jgi:hypothetical protein